MKKQHFSEVESSEEGAPASGVKVRWLIDERSGAPTFAMRRFDIAPGGHTPLHAHDWEHEVFVLNGSGTVLSDDGESAFAPGDAIFVPGGEKHQFKNTGTEPAAILCLVPIGTRNK